MIIFGILIAAFLVWLLLNITSAYVVYADYVEGTLGGIKGTKVVKFFFYLVYGAGILFALKVMIPIYGKKHK